MLLAASSEPHPLVFSFTLATRRAPASSLMAPGGTRPGIVHRHREARQGWGGRIHDCSFSLLSRCRRRLQPHPRCFLSGADDCPLFRPPGEAQGYQAGLLLSEACCGPGASALPQDPSPLLESPDTLRVQQVAAAGHSQCTQQTSRGQCGLTPRLVCAHFPSLCPDQAKSPRTSVFQVRTTFIIRKPVNP